MIKKQTILSYVINEIVNKYNITKTNDLSFINSIPTNRSFITNLCNHIVYPDDKDRYACCWPVNIRYIYNAQITNSLNVFKGQGNNIFKSDFHDLPMISSFKLQKKHEYRIPYSEIAEDFPNTCKSIFNGTLHVTGRYTVHNVYHTLSDNYFPLLTQILYDQIIAPEFLHLPRIQLVGFQPYEDPTPHLSLVDDLMTAGTISVNQANGMCFRRIIWGQRPGLLYHDSDVLLRRITSDFARLLVSKVYDIPIPKDFEESSIDSNISSNIKLFSVDSKKPLRVVLFSRGSSGTGRTIKNEQLIIDKLRSLGVLATQCCDYKQVTLQQQIGYAYHADVIMGLHGAALAHGVFSKHGLISVELKTLYAYSSILFGIISDSRIGIHSQVDIRDYFIPGGHKPVDDGLVSRVIDVLNETLIYQYQYNNQLTNESIRIIRKPGDFLYNHIELTPVLNHLLGPKKSIINEICNNSTLAKVRDILVSKEDGHCDSC